MRNLRLSITVIPITDEYDILATTLIETEVRQMMERVLPLVPVKTVANPLSCVSSSICLGPYVDLYTSGTLQDPHVTYLHQCLLHRLFNAFFFCLSQCTLPAYIKSGGSRDPIELIIVCDYVNNTIRNFWDFQRFLSPTARLQFLHSILFPRHGFTGKASFTFITANCKLSYVAVMKNC